MSTKHVAHGTHLRPKANPERKLRPCIKCKALFESEHIGNRMCESCKRWASDGIRRPTHHNEITGRAVMR